MVKRISPNSRLLVNCVKAFFFGGFICGLAQLFNNMIVNIGFSSEESHVITLIAFIFIASLLTGLGVYDKIAKHAGAGTIVPITGFSNSITAPAVEFKKEGFIFGVGAKMFAVAGPVIVYGLATSVVVGLVYYVISK